MSAESDARRPVGIEHPMREAGLPWEEIDRKKVRLRELAGSEPILTTFDRVVEALEKANDRNEDHIVRGLD